MSLATRWVLNDIGSPEWSQQRSGHRGWQSLLLWAVAAASVISHVATIALHLPQGVGGAPDRVVANAIRIAAWRVDLWLRRGILIFLVICLGVSNAFLKISAS